MREASVRFSFCTIIVIIAENQLKPAACDRSGDKVLITEMAGQIQIEYNG